MSVVELTVKFTSITCCYKECGIVFAVPFSWDRQRRSDHSDWYCPNGHIQHYSGESDAEREKRLRLAAERERDMATRGRDIWKERVEHEQRSHAATRGHLTRAKRRAAAGVCPCCSREFQNLKRHMHTKHPDYAEGAAR